jgi:hypothetical protein
VRVYVAVPLTGEKLVVKALGVVVVPPPAEAVQLYV